MSVRTPTTKGTKHTKIGPDPNFVAFVSFVVSTTRALADA
jgi:hypothetical protein